MFGGMGRRMGRMGGLGSAGTPAGPFDPATYGLDALDNLYNIAGVARLLTAWTGNLVRLRRSSDNAESNFGYDTATGFLDGSSITTWRDAAGAATAYVTTLYDQSGNGRDWSQATAGSQPELDVTGAHPVVAFDGTGRTLTSAGSLGFARNIGAASLVAVRKYSTTWPSGGQIMLNVSINPFNNGRAILQRPASGLFTAAGRRLDADASSISAGLTGDANWGTQIGRYDWANSNLYHRVESATETKTDFTTDGLTQDTDSLVVSLGALSGTTNRVGSGAAVAMVGLIRDLLTDPEDLSLVTSLAGLKL